MNEQILESITKGELILFLGAGASFGCETRDGKPILMSTELAKKLADAAHLEFQDEALDVVYEAARQVLGNRLDAILEEQFRYVRPSREYERIAAQVWRRIYTLNIDDALDTALTKHSVQRINKRSAHEPVVDRNSFFEVLEYVKLNGSADRIHDGIIFSPSEYAKAAANSLPWYSQCASDFVRSPILFIGTTLNEPLLKFHIERYQGLNPKPLGTSYLIAKSATPIQIASLKRYKIEFVQGTLADFVEWLGEHFQDPPRTIDVATASIPELREFLQSSNRKDFADLFEHVTAVKRDVLTLKDTTNTSTIRDFYRGFKPTWTDVVESIPAQLDALKVVTEKVERFVDNPERLITILGPAGCGKTTLLMQACWHFSHSSSWSVYFIESLPVSLLETLIAIEKSATTQKIIVAIDNIEFFTDQLQFALNSGRLKRTLILSAERESAWNRRAKFALVGMYQTPVLVKEFSQDDAHKILEKLELYGSWTRLGKMKQSERVKELVNRSRKQLLIALLEATSGRGFEKIIEEEYSKIESNDERLFLVAIAITTDRRCDVHVSLIDRALDKMSILRKAGAFADDLAGIVHKKREHLTARHPVYARYLLDKVVDPTIAAKAVDGLLQAFADYESPVIQNMPRSEAVLYKALINHKFLFDLLKGNKEKIVRTFSGLEKKFERDGLFWLQYGLSLRDLEEHDDALEKLRVAYEAYPMPHTEHALAQQMLQVALSKSDAPAAMGLAEEAKQMLERLDGVMDSDDTYPIVTLSEGYTNVLRRHGSEIEARDCARRFSVLLGLRSKLNPDKDRLRFAYERIFKYASVGVWDEPT